MERLAATLAERGPMTAFEAVPGVHGAEPTEATGSWWLQETLCCLRHLEAAGRATAERAGDGAPERWKLTG